MIDRTATARLLPRANMLAPLAIFFVACFFIAGVLKFRAFGNDLWLARPAGAIVTCLFLGFVAWLAGRWFFGDPPRAIGRKMLSALVVLLPLMGLLGAFQLTTKDATTAAQDPTPLGGSLGLMLAGPKAFGLLGSTIAGILFATLAGIGCMLARRMTFDARVKAAGEDPYAVIKAMHQKRTEKPEPAAAATAVVEEEEAPAAAEEGASLFPVDAELEPETASAAAPGPMAELEVVEEIGPAIALEEPPKRMPVLAGIVDEAVEEQEDDLPPARFLATSLVLEPETSRPEPMVIDLDEPVMAGAVQEAEVEIAVGMEMEQAGAPEAEPEVESRPRIMVLPPPTIEPEEETSLDPEDEDDPMTDEPELSGIVGGEAPELTLEWMAAPAAFHTPRLADEEPVVTNEATEEILDVETAPEPEQQAEPEAEPEPAPMPERRRIRVKAVVEEETPPPVVVEIAPEPAPEPEPAPVMTEEPVFEIPAELAAQLLGEPTPLEVEAVAETPVEQPEPTAEPEAVEAQLELPSMPAPVAQTADPEEAEESRPKRRLRSAKKDWASWDEPKSKERPRLRLVKSDEPVTEEAETQAEIPIATGGADDSYDRAVKLVVKEDRCSVSLLQRNLGVTFGEATALIDRMYQQGVVGPYQPTGRRDVLLGKKGKAAEES